MTLSRSQGISQHADRPSWTRRQGNTVRSGKNQTNGRWDNEFGPSFAAEERQSGAAVRHGQVDKLAAVPGDRLHGDGKKLAKRLVEILEPQLRTHLGGAEVEAKLPGTRVDLGERCSALESELRYRDN